MKTEVKKVDSTIRELNIEVSGDVVRNKFENVFKAIGKEAKIPGFRPGSAPRDILERNFSSQAHEQVLKELIPDIYSQAINQEKLDVVEMPEISEVKLDRTKLSFRATVSVIPQIQLKEYKGLKVKYRTIQVTPDEIKRSMDSLKEAGKPDSLDDAFAKGIAYPNAAELEKSMERQIFLQKENQQRQRIESELIENLVKGMDFKLPQSLVKRQAQDMLRQAKVNLAMKGVPQEKIAEEESELLKELEPQAKKQVKVYFVLAEIAKKENIPLDDSMPRRVIEFLLREANWEISEAENRE